MNLVESRETCFQIATTLRGVLVDFSNGRKVQFHAFVVVWVELFAFEFVVHPEGGLLRNELYRPFAHSVFHLLEVRPRERALDSSLMKELS